MPANGDPPRSGRTLRVREEDPPPGQYQRRNTPQGESIARQALRAERKPELDPHEQVMSAIAQTEEHMLAELADRREAFEAEMRRELSALVVRQVKESIPPPSMRKSRFEWPHLQYVAGFIVALTGLVALILNARAPSEAVIKRFEAIEQKHLADQVELQKQLDAFKSEVKTKREESYKYELDSRAWVSSVLEKAASVKIDDPPGTPARGELGFYPPPRFDPHRVTDTHMVQPREPFPVPPQP